MEERRLGPVVGLGTWNTFVFEVHTLVARAEYLPWLDPGEREPTERLAGA